MRAALEEFAEKGYDLASTNSIIEKAGISKGLLFHYFGSKKNLYLHLVRHVADRYVERFNRARLTLHPDLLERVLQLAAFKRQVLAEDPVMAKFYARAFLEPPDDEVRAELQELYSRLAALSGEVLVSGLDTSRFRPDIDPDKAVTLVRACLEGLQAIYKDRVDPETVDRPDEIEAIMADTRDYLEMLKYGVYRRGENGSPREENRRRRGDREPR